MLGLFLFACVPGWAQRNGNQAKKILDQTAETFRLSGGVSAAFMLNHYLNNVIDGKSAGSIQLQGDKFVLTAGGITTWFDGRTQWSYVVENEEVNVTTPTSQELQQLNPYAFLQLYRQGYDFHLGTISSFAGKQVWDILLVANVQKQEFSRIRLYIAKEGYRPLFIRLERKDEPAGSWAEIVITDYRVHQHYEDAFFIFDSKRYPDAEIIDLR
ncbi:hypothetical protein EVA_20253 [gut metagenome]|uniref:Outer membrane lipoprotein carrier protein LolA n=1 Tax=gut metagenome TaxID=749906 RepID=J9FWE3_9ZZZZ